MSKKKVFRDDYPTSVLLPANLQRKIHEVAQREDRSFAAVMRRALEKEIESSYPQLGPESGSTVGKEHQKPKNP